jgi:hypothetical protein
LFDRGTNKEIVVEYLRTTQNLIQAEQQIEKIFANPTVTNKETASNYVRSQRDRINRSTELTMVASCRSNSSKPDQ